MMSLVQSILQFCLYGGFLCSESFYNIKLKLHVKGRGDVMMTVTVRVTGMRTMTIMDECFK